MCNVEDKTTWDFLYIQFSEYKYAYLNDVLFFEFKKYIYFSTIYLKFKTIYRDYQKNKINSYSIHVEIDKFSPNLRKKIIGINAVFWVFLLSYDVSIRSMQYAYRYLYFFV